MESHEQFHLSWNNHKTNVMNGFEDLLHQGDFVDVTLACDGGTLKAHKVVLSSCSSYFRRILKENPCKHPVVILKDTTYGDMKLLIGFMYKGEVDVFQKQLATFLDLAEKLEIKGLTEMANSQDRPQCPPQTEGPRIADVSHCPADLWSEVDICTASPTDPTRKRILGNSTLSQPKRRREINDQSTSQQEVILPIIIPKTEISSDDESNVELMEVTPSRLTLSGRQNTSQEFEDNFENEMFTLNQTDATKIDSPSDVSSNVQSRLLREMSNPIAMGIQSSSNQGWSNFGENVAGASVTHLTPATSTQGVEEDIDTNDVDSIDIDDIDGSSSSMLGNPINDAKDSANNHTEEEAVELVFVDGALDDSGKPGTEGLLEASTRDLPTRIVFEQPADVKQAIEDFQPPKMFTRVDISRKKGRGPNALSAVDAFGVRVVSLAFLEGSATKGSPYYEVWYCLASLGCRNKGRKITLKRGITSNASAHLKKIHNIISERSASIKYKKEKESSQLKQVEENLVFQSSSKRFHSLHWTVIYAIKKMIPFSWLDDEHARRVNSIDCSIPIDVSSKDVKHHIIEIYDATKKIFVEHLQKEVRASPIPLLHLNCDIYVSNTSKEKYIAIQVFFVDSNFSLHSYPLAVKRFCPSKDLVADKVHLSKVIAVWVEQVYAEYGLDLYAHTYGSISEGESDVKRMLSIILDNKPWDWCVSHLLNSALMEAFGYNTDYEEKSKNQGAQGMRVIVKMIESLNENPSIKTQFKCLHEEIQTTLTLPSDCPQRWTTTVHVLERILLCWKTFRSLYNKQNLPFSLDETKDQIVQLFSLMKPITDIIVMAQGTNHPPMIETLVAIAKLKKGLLNSSRPLIVYDPTVESSSNGHYHKCEVAPENLDELAKVTRTKLCAALESRFYETHASATRSSMLLDMAACLHPSFRNMPYLNLMMGAPQAQDIRARVHREIKELGANIIENYYSSTDTGNNRSRRKCTNRQNIPEYPRIEGEDDNFLSETRSEEIISQELELFLKNERHTISAVPHNTILQYWQKNRVKYPRLSLIAQVVYGHPLSTTAIERDFGPWYNITDQQSHLDCIFAEMILFLKANFQLIPPTHKIPAISRRDIKSYIPQRLLDKKSFLEVASLDCGVETITMPTADGNDDLDGLECVNSEK